MAGHWLTAQPYRYHGAEASARPVLTATRRFVQGLGGLIAIGLSAAMPWAEFERSGIHIAHLNVPPAALAVAGCMFVVGLLFLMSSTWGLVRRLKRSTRWLCLATAVIGLCSIAGAEYGYLRTGGLSAYEYRPAVRMVGFAMGILLLACSVPEGLGFQAAFWIKRHRPGWRSVAGAGLLATVAGALIGRFLLDGMPHIIDGTTYLLEARTLWSGRMALETPMFPELFAGELLEFRISDAGFYGKYPIGWPLILGLFDAVRVPWLAAPVLSGVLVGLTYFVVRQRGDDGLAAGSAVFAGLCPWLWFNAGTMMSHLASAVWLMLFLGALLRGVQRESRGWLVCSGGALGLAVMTRPADAAFFAIPALGYGFAKLVQSPRFWITRLPLVPLATLPGLFTYKWAAYRVSGGGSSYGGGETQELFKQMPASPLHALVWLQESWAGLSSQWAVGAIPVGVLIICGLFFGRKQSRGQGLFLMCSGSLFLCYAVFVFGGKAWVGPRWYVPLIPAGSLLIVSGVLAAAQTARIACADGVLSAGYLRTLAVALVVTVLVILPTRLFELRTNPPHGIDGRLARAVDHAQLGHAVVALPVNGLVEGTTQPNYKRGIAGMWTLQTPFEESPVIYIRAIDGWQAKARQAWPDRDLYYLTGELNDYQIRPAAGSPFSATTSITEPAP